MKMNLTEILRKASECGYVEGGVQTRNFTKKLSEKADTVVVAINNGDLAGAYASLFTTKPVSIVKGAMILAQIHGAKNLVIHIPEGYEVPSFCCSDGIRVSVDYGMVNKRNYPDAVFHHIATAVNFAEIDDGSYTDGICVSLNGGALVRYAPETTLSEIAEKCGVPADDTTSVISGFRLLGKEALSQPICELLPENGAVRLVSAKECPVEITSEMLAEAYRKSCGKCTFCREGLNQLALMIGDVSDGKGKIGYVDIVREIASAMKNGTLCTLGQNCGDVALGLLSNENAEVVKHIKRKRCTPGVCFSNDTYYVDPTLCTGCGDCRCECEADAIDGMNGYIHMIDSLDCTRCGKCAPKCSAGAIKITTARVPKLPDRLTRVGHFKRY